MVSSLVNIFILWQQSLAFTNLQSDRIGKRILEKVTEAKAAALIEQV